MPFRVFGIHQGMIKQQKTNRRLALTSRMMMFIPHLVINITEHSPFLGNMVNLVNFRGLPSPGGVSP